MKAVYEKAHSASLMKGIKMNIHATTILGLRHNGLVAMGGDGQVTLGRRS